MEQKQKAPLILWLLAAGYAAIMVFLLFFREINQTNIPYSERLQQHINLIPFSTISLFLRGMHRVNRPIIIRISVVNLFGNVLMFIPLGVFPPLLWDKMRKFWRTALFAAGIILAIEVSQLLLLVGLCDIDDLILNLSGAALGYGLYYITRRNKNQNSSSGI